MDKQEPSIFVEASRHTEDYTPITVNTNLQNPLINLASKAHSDIKQYFQITCCSHAKQLLK